MMMFFIQKALDSPTITTWFSFTARGLMFLVVLPLILTNYSPDEVALWQLLATIANFQFLAAMGFNSNFTRIVAYSYSGIDDLSKEAIEKTGRQENTSVDFNQELFLKIACTSKSLYFVSAGFYFAVFGIAGSILLARPISRLAVPVDGWIAWGIVLCITTIILRFSYYAPILMGSNYVALLRRWESITTTAIVLILSCSITLGVDFKILVAIYQISLLGQVIRNRFLIANVLDRKVYQKIRAKIDKNIFKFLWPAVWRSGIGIAMSYSIIHGPSFVYSQFYGGESLAAFLIAIKVVQMINLYSQAPFYSKLPLLAQLYAQGGIRKQIDIATKGMLRAYCVHAGSCILIGIFGHEIFKAFGSNVAFIERKLWFLMCLGFFIERYGAMHLQLYTTTNVIIWHIANGVTAFVFAICIWITFKHFGFYSFPISCLIAYGGFYSWYAAIHSYKKFGLKIKNFELQTSFVPLCGLIATSIYYFI